ncbi:MAG: class I tRNA ligase family protein, partial [Hymenobacteraceae bacterium]|nr:class I tRNA ligase family protein [Hymenobacteraceae bacterium]
GWFFTLHALAVLLEDSVAFKNVIANGLVLDKEGNKMSKRLGNAVDPFATIAQYGPDATRWYMIANAPPWENLKFDPAGIVEVQRRFFGTLLNTYAFFALYANLDGFQVREFDLVPMADRPELDRWILSKLHSLIAEVRGHYDAYDPTKAARAIQEFTTDQLSNWYVRLSRGRFRKGDLTPDKKAAFETLHECLMIVGQLMAPIAPFFAEWLYQNMTQHLRVEAVKRRTPLAPESVHLSLLVAASPELMDGPLETRMALAQQVCSLGHALRKKAVIKVRQPLPRLLVPVLTEAAAADLRAVADLIAAELNVKAVEPVGREANLLIKSARPNFKTVGKRFGPRLKAATAAIQALSREEIDTLETTGVFRVEVEGEEETLTPADVEIRTEDVPGYASATENGITVALDLTLTDELRLEGVARELVNRLQNLRKDSGLDVQDRIRVRLANSQPELNQAVITYGEIVRAEVQALVLETVPDIAATATLTFDEYEVGVQLEVISN